MAMNILFLTTGRMDSIEQHAIYPDLLRCFRDNGHNIYTVSSYEKRIEKETELIEEHGVHMLHVRIGNLTQTNFIEKGFSTIMIEKQFLLAIKKYLSSVKFDLVMYSTPPITLAKVIKYIKKRDNCKTYLLLKDIFPQNAVDLGLMQKTGIKGLLYKFFRHKEKTLYALSDKIGCMSEANCDYVLKHNPMIKKSKVEVCPNSIEPIDMRVTKEENKAIRRKYGLPLNKTIIVYGGNLGRPQNVPFIVRCLKICADIDGAFFVIAGGGTDGHFLEEYVKIENPTHVKLFGFMSKAEYDKMIACCDVGLIFLDHRFTIPNFPSRLLSYMQAGLPVLACTDPNTDVGRVILDGGFGWWCESNDADRFREIVELITYKDYRSLQNAEWEILNKNYSVNSAYQIIINNFQDVEGYDEK